MKLLSDSIWFLKASTLIKFDNAIRVILQIIFRAVYFFARNRNGDWEFFMKDISLVLKREERVRTTANNLRCSGQ